MEIHHLEGVFSSDDRAQIALRLRSVRKGPYGAFHLASGDYPYLAIHFNGDIAYLHYFPSDGHPGYQPSGMTPPDLVGGVHFLNLDGHEAGAFDLPASVVVDASDAVAAALEFTMDQKMPASIDWQEL